MQEKNWKEKLIAGYVLLQKENENILQEITDNQEIQKLREQRTEITQQIDTLRKPYDVRLGNIDDKIGRIKDLFVGSWDIEEKTYKCNFGTATLRTTRSLIIKDKTQLMQRLSEVLTRHFAEACEYIKTFDLTKIRKIKEINLLDDAIVSWDEKKSIIIKNTEKNYIVTEQEIVKKDYIEEVTKNSPGVIIGDGGLEGIVLEDGNISRDLSIRRDKKGEI